MRQDGPLRLVGSAALWLAAAAGFGASSTAADSWLVPPANDLCAGAEVLPGSEPFPLLSAVTPDISDATLTGDPSVSSCQSNVSRSLWYRFTPSATAEYRICSCADAPTASTVDDTVIGVYTSTGGCGGVFSHLTCDDDACNNEFLQSDLSAHLNSLVPYYILVWKFDTPAPTAGNTAIQLRITSLALFADGFETGDTSRWGLQCLPSSSPCMTSAQCCSGICNAGFCV